MPSVKQNLYNEYRCKNCSKLFFKGILVDSEIEVKCKRCGEIRIIKGIPANKYVCFKVPCPHRVYIKETAAGA
ncbi:MAG: Com family DNA-binding transcriptional regulator [Patescibacteria group bacterium]